MNRREVLKAAGVLAAASVLPAGDALALEPRGRILWGMYNSAGLGSLEQKLGRRFALEHKYAQWSTDWPTSAYYDSHRKGRKLLVNWKPSLPWYKVARGDVDHAIVRRADKLRRFGHEIFYAFAHEPENDWGHPDDWQRAFRRVRRIFRDHGAKNAKATSLHMSGTYRNEGGDRKRIKLWYPGGDDIDVVGVDGFDWHGCKSWSPQPRRFKDLFQAANEFARNHHKPLFIGEYGADEISGTTKKAQWIRDAGHAAANFSNLRGMAWFNSNDQGCQWPVTSSTSALRAFRDVGERYEMKGRL